MCVCALAFKLQKVRAEMGDYREDSPDWLRSFQAPTCSIMSLSSDPEASDDNNSLRGFSEEDDSDFKPISKKTTKKQVKVDVMPAKMRKTKKDKRGSEDENDVDCRESSDSSERARLQKKRGAMDDCREISPDWLRTFQAPTCSITTLSSDSEASGDDDSVYNEEVEEISDLKSFSKKTTNKLVKLDESPAKRRKITKDKGGCKDDNDVDRGESAKKRTGTRKQSILALSSDFESDERVSAREEEIEESSMHVLPDAMAKEGINDDDGAPKVAAKKKSPKKQSKLASVKPKNKTKTNKAAEIEVKEKEAKEELSAHDLSESSKEEDGDIVASASKAVMKSKFPKKQMRVEGVVPAGDIEANEPLKWEGDAADMDVTNEGLPEKHVGSCVTSSKLPLVLPEKVSRLKALVECEGESIDLGGDMGAVGRVIISETPSGEPDMLLDLKGTIYRTTIVSSGTYCVVSVGQSEAKVEAIMNDFIQLKPQSNVYDAETMVEGTLGELFLDSDDEPDNMAKDTKDEQYEGAEEQTGKKSKGKAVKKSVATQKKGKAAAGKLPKKRKPQATKRSKAKK